MAYRAPELTGAFHIKQSRRRAFLVRLGAAMVFLAPALLFSGGAPALAQSADIPSMEMKFGHPYNEKHPLAQAAVMFSKIIGEKTGGKIKINVYPNSTIGNPRALIESMQIGVVDMALAPTTNVASFYHPLNLYYLPFLFRDSRHAYHVADGPVGKELNDGLLKKIGIRTLGMYESGFRTITTRKTAVHMPDDMKGVKFRVVNNPLNVATFKALGANPTPMPLSEVFTGLQQGTVDGQDNPIGNVVAFGFDKVQSYITLSHHQWAGIMVLIGEKTWAKLPPKVQAIFSDAAAETQAWERKELNKNEENYLKAMKEHGMTVIELNEAQKKAFQDKMKDVWDQYGPKIGDKLIKDAVATK